MGFQALKFHKRSNKSVVYFGRHLHMKSYKYHLTLCLPDGLLIKYPQFLDVLNALNVQPHNIFLLTV